jgi:hypothetical protein
VKKGECLHRALSETMASSSSVLFSTIGNKTRSSSWLKQLTASSFDPNSGKPGNSKDRHNVAKAWGKRMEDTTVIFK